MMKTLLVPFFVMFAAALWAQDRPRCQGSTCDTSRKNGRPKACKDDECKVLCEQACGIEEGRTYTFRIVIPETNAATAAGPKIAVFPVGASNPRGRK